MKSFGRWSRRLWLVAMLLGVLLTLHAWAADGDWEKIDVSDSFRDYHGVWRYPSCSGGPVPTSTGLLTAANTTFSFFVRWGDPKKLVIAWDGGGACWDPNTCVGSAIAGHPIYDQEVGGTIGEELGEEMGHLAGLADAENPANPVGDSTLVFIPYCTGDLHTGAKDTTYAFVTSEGTTIPWTIHHRGFDNTIAVLTWLMGHYNEVGSLPLDVFLTGASAGGYGVLYTYPTVHALLQWHPRIRVLSDSANGVINQDFYNRVLGAKSVWGIWDTIAPELIPAFTSGPDLLAAEINASLGRHYPQTRFGQDTRAFDAVQVFFYNVAKHVDTPALWEDPAQLLVAGVEWTLKARASMWLSALTTWNYRFYLAQGTEHTIIADNSFYTEHSAKDVLFRDWVDDMIHRLVPWGSDWRNVSCAPDCLP